ncbi:TIGR03757 family integrating conjugative element protein [Paraburkholderia aspalathi]|uniref:Integrating conjugative element protein, PFL_4709 family n=1 Tax=Paraburkholderia aspalathi TaxID=1324617 RepID=A0A1I7ABU5_9BURK|nr:TIGR03757 family integrating conjugative element protein [Paraburkholderia aspalathi]SFT72402.1 integrating conjugative element protein, PFL_4709 family [Paraburkholderia aspalathi]
MFPTPVTRHLAWLAITLAFACALPSVRAADRSESTDIQVFTDGQHPAVHASTARVVLLDAPARLEATLSDGLPPDATAATAIVQQRLKQHPDLQRDLASAYQGVADAWSLGIAKVPAIVVDRRYVVYGTSDVARAAARISAYRSSHP